MKIVSTWPTLPPRFSLMSHFLNDKAYVHCIKEYFLYSYGQVRSDHSSVTTPVTMGQVIQGIQMSLLS